MKTFKLGQSVEVNLLIIHSFMSGSKNTAGEGLQNLDLCSLLVAFEQGEIFIVSHLLFWSHPKDRPIQSPLTTRKGVLRPNFTRIFTKKKFLLQMFRTAIALTVAICRISRSL
jgi:hypothetical protein